MLDQGVVMPCGLEGNHRSGITLAMCHRLQWFIHLGALGLWKGVEHPAYSLCGVYGTCHSFLYLLVAVVSDAVQSCGR